MLDFGRELRVRAATVKERLPPARPQHRLALQAVHGYCKAMAEAIDSDPLVCTDEVEVDAETLAAIDRGIKDADEGRTVSIDEVRKMIPKWISKFESQKPR